MGDRRAIELADDAAVAQHDDAVGAALDLVQAVRDEDDADAALLQLGDDAHEGVGLGEREARGRLVHDDQAGVERERLGDLDQLHLRQRQLGDGRIRLELDAEALEQRLHLLVQLLAVDQLEGAAVERLAADEDVGGDVQIVEEVQLLVDEGDAAGDGVADGERADSRGRRCGWRRSSARSTPPRIFISVDLPAPFSPMRPSTSPRRTARSTRSSATTPGIGLADADEFEPGIGHEALRTCDSSGVIPAKAGIAGRPARRRPGPPLRGG